MLYFGIVGYGNIGKRHRQTIESIAESTLVAISDPFVNTESEDAVPFYQDIGEMLQNHPEINVVCICSPNGLHAANGIQCIKAGKHVLIEKPLALNKKEAEELIFHSLQQNVKVFCVMQNRFTPVANYLKSLIENHQFGKLLELQMFLSWNRGTNYYMSGGKNHSWRGNKQLDGGPLFTQFSHFIDLIYWLFGDIKLLHVTTRNLNHTYIPDLDDSGIITFTFDEGALGTLHYSINAPHENITSTFTIIGSQGAITVSGQYLDQISYLSIKNEQTIPSLPNQIITGHEMVIRNVISAIRGDEKISTNVLEGMKVVEIIENIYNFEKRD